MKKAKQKNLYEDKSDPMGDLGMQHEGDDEEIIELEDIIEMPDRPIDEEEDLDLDVEIFDVDEELESPPEAPAREAARRPVKEGAREAEDAELLKSFAEQMGEDDMLFEPSASDSQEEPPAEKAQPQVSDQEEEPTLEDLPAKPDTAETQREKQAALRARAEAALKFTEESRSEKAEEAEEALEAIPGEPAGQPAEAAPASVEDASVSEITAVAEELVDRIESRLQQHIRVVVESMLPDLVRSILDEEITKLKKELE